MGLYKLCPHKGRHRDRCEHPWWGSFRGTRASLSKWANRAIASKTEALAVLDDLRKAIRAGTYEAQPATPEPTPDAITFRQVAELYKDRHVIAKRLTRAKTIDYQLRPLLARFGDQAMAQIRTADIEDFITSLREKTSRRKL